MHVTNEDFKMLLDDGLQASPQEMKRYLHLKAQYEFKDDIPKDTLIVKTREGLDLETSSEIKHGLLQFVDD